jgi:hypothetical protein
MDEAESPPVHESKMNRYVCKRLRRKKVRLMVAFGNPQAKAEDAEG